MGHRIELGEIEAALNAIDFIDVACCFYDQKKEKIICVYQAEEDRRKQIIQALSDRLPKYMRPNRYLRMEQMPLNAHAKIDRRLLRTMYEEGRI
jgi:acyl-coenzyme A synthetase/AMP-(fatty) acid ligase